LTDSDSGNCVGALLVPLLLVIAVGETVAVAGAVLDNAELVGVDDVASVVSLMVE